VPEDSIVTTHSGEEPPISPPEQGHRWGIAKTSMFAALLDGALAMTVIILIPGALPRREVGFILFMASYVWISFWPVTALLTWGYRKKGWSSRLELAAVVGAAPLLILVVVFIIAIIAVS
jgi:hypothetical protein